MGCTFSVFTTSINMHIVEYINQWQFERNQNSLLIWNIDCTSSGGLETVSFIWYTWWRHQMETFYALLAICVWGGGIHRWIPPTNAGDAELRCFYLICALLNGCVDNREDCDLRRHRAHYYIIVSLIVIRLNVLCSLCYIIHFELAHYWIQLM